MASTLWTGSISFGLVTIPVSLVTAEVREELDFTLLDRRDDSPIGYQKISKRTGKPVPADRIVRGFEYQDGRYVVLSDADLRRASSERTQRIDVLSFVEAAEIPPTYFDRPYYLEPARGGERGYVLFREALRRTGRVAVATVVVKTRQHLAAILVQDRVLVLDVLRYASELRDPSRLRVPGPNLKALRVSDRELRMAERLIAEMTGPWEPERYHDEYRDELMAFIKKRGRAGRLASAAEPEEEPARRPRADVIDIADLLRKSLAGKGSRVRSKPVEERRRPRRRKTA
jgi:DNA end-binding protein Ku